MSRLWYVLTVFWGLGEYMAALPRLTRGLWVWRILLACPPWGPMPCSRNMVLSGTVFWMFLMWVSLTKQVSPITQPSAWVSLTVCAVCR